MSPGLSLFLWLCPPVLICLLGDTLLKMTWWKPVFRWGIPLGTWAVSDRGNRNLTEGDLTLIFNQADQSSTMRFKQKGTGFLFRSIFFSQGNSDTGFTLQAIALFDGVMVPTPGGWIIRPILNSGRLAFFILISAFLGWLISDLLGPAGRGDALAAVAILGFIFLSYIAFSATIEWGRLKKGSVVLGEYLVGQRSIPRPGAEDYH